MTIVITTNASTVYEFFVPFDKWFSENPFKGICLYSASFLLYVPLALPTSVLITVGGFIFSHNFGPFKGFFICLLAIIVGHPVGCLFCYFIGKVCLKNYIQNNLIKKIRIFSAIDKSL